MAGVECWRRLYNVTVINDLHECLALTTKILTFACLFDFLRMSVHGFPVRRLAPRLFKAFLSLSDLAKKNGKDVGEVISIPMRVPSGLVVRNQQQTPRSTRMHTAGQPLSHHANRALAMVCA